MYDAFRALDRCEPDYLQVVAQRLKQSDGEGWAVGNAIEQYLVAREGEKGVVPEEIAPSPRLPLVARVAQNEEMIASLGRNLEKAFYLLKEAQDAIAMLRGQVLSPENANE